LGRVDEEIARAARYRRPMSVILLDLDHFKRLNDSHGHAAGDLVLRQVERTSLDEPAGAAPAPAA